MEGYYDIRTLTGQYRVVLAGGEPLQAFADRSCNYAYPRGITGCHSQSEHSTRFHALRMPKAETG